MKLQKFFSIIFIFIVIFISCTKDLKSNDFTSIKENINEAIKLKTSIGFSLMGKDFSSYDLSDKDISIELKNDVIICNSKNEQLRLPYQNISYLLWRMEPYTKYKQKLIKPSEMLEFLEKENLPLEEIDNRMQNLKIIHVKSELLIKVIY